MLGGQPLICPTALCFAGPDILYACQGSARHAPEEWQRSAGAPQKRDGLAHRASSGAAELPGEGLGFPNGMLLIDGGRRIAIAESWRHRLLAIETARHATPEILLDDLPGYPGRLCPAGGSGAWLAVFAPAAGRSRLFCASTPPRDDAGDRARLLDRPGLRPVRRPGARRHGRLGAAALPRPGAASRRGFRPVAALHGRAAGRRHGVTSCLEIEGNCWSPAGVTIC
jgi:hypothetical protein